jgi:hypothetical protein
MRPRAEGQYIRARGGLEKDAGNESRESHTQAGSRECNNIAKLKIKS